MCGPAAIVMVGVMMVSAVMAGVMAKNAADGQAAVHRQAAANKRTEGEMRAAELQRRTDRVVGMQAALAGASGADLSGSLVDVLADTQASGARDQFNTRWTADAAADNLEASASNIETQGTNQMWGSIIQGALKSASIVGGGMAGGAAGGAGSSLSAGTSFSEMSYLSMRGAGPSAI